MKTIPDYLKTIQMNKETVSILNEVKESGNISILINYLIQNDRFNKDLIDILTKELTDPKIVKMFLDEKNFENIILDNLNNKPSIDKKKSMMEFYKYMLNSEHITMNNKIFLLNTLDTFINNQGSNRSFLYINEEEKERLKDFGDMVSKRLIEFIMESKEKVSVHNLALYNFLFTKYILENRNHSINELKDKGLDRHIYIYDITKTEELIQNKDFFNEFITILEDQNKLLKDENLSKIKINNISKITDLVFNSISNNSFLPLINTQDKFDRILKIISSTNLIINVKKLHPEIKISDEQLKKYFNNNTPEELIKDFDLRVDTNFHGRGYVKRASNQNFNNLRIFLMQEFFYESKYAKEYIKMLKNDIIDLIEEFKEKKGKKLEEKTRKQMFNNNYFYPTELTTKIEGSTCLFDKLPKDIKNSIYEVFLDIHTNRNKTEVSYTILEEITMKYNGNLSRSLEADKRETLRKIFNQQIDLKDIIDTKNYSKTEIENLAIYKLEEDLTSKKDILVEPTLMEKKEIQINKIEESKKYINKERLINFIIKKGFDFYKLYKQKDIDELIKKEGYFRKEFLSHNIHNNTDYINFFKLIDKEIIEELILEHEDLTILGENIYATLYFLIQSELDEKIIKTYLKKIDFIDLKNTFIPMFSHSKGSSYARNDEEREFNKQQTQNQNESNKRGLELIKSINIYKEGTKNQIELIKIIESQLFPFTESDLIPFIEKVITNEEKEEARANIYTMLNEFLEDSKPKKKIKSKSIKK